MNDMYLHGSRTASVSEESSPESSVTPRVSLLEVLTRLALHKWLILKVTGVGILTGLVLSFVLPVRYSARTLIMPPQQSQSAASLLMNQLVGGGSGTGSLAAMAGAGLGLKNPNDICIGLLKSRPVADAIIDKFRLSIVYRAKDMTAARQRLAKKTEIVSEKSGFISVTVTDNDKVRAAEMANAYTESLRALTKNLAITEASQRRLFYEDQLKQAKDALVTAESDFEQVQQKRGLVALDSQAKAMIESLASLRAQVAAKQVQVQAMQTYSTESNPDIQMAERELSSLQAQVARLEERSRSSEFGNLGLRDVPGAGLEYLRAEHEAKYRQALFDLLLKQYDAARMDEAKDAAVIQVVESAIAPDRKSSPKRALITIFLTMLGFISGCLLVLFKWWKELVTAEPLVASQFSEFRSALIGPRPERR